MPETRDVVAMQHTYGMLAREFGARSTSPADAADLDPRLQLGRALEHLYAGLNDLYQGRPAPLQQVWSHAPDATLATPATGTITGWEAIRAQFDHDALHTGGQTVIAEDVAITLCIDAAWAVCTERTRLPLADGQPTELRQQSTNIFRRESGTWRLVHRHVGPVA